MAIIQCEAPSFSNQNPNNYYGIVILKNLQAINQCDVESEFEETSAKIISVENEFSLLVTKLSKDEDEIEQRRTIIWNVLQLCGWDHLANQYNDLDQWSISNSYNLKCITTIRVLESARRMDFF